MFEYNLKNKISKELKSENMKLTPLQIKIFTKMRCSIPNQHESVSLVEYFYQSLPEKSRNINENQVT